MIRRAVLLIYLMFASGASVERFRESRPAPVVSLAYGMDRLFAARGNEIVVFDGNAPFDTLKTTKIEGMEKICSVAISPDGSRVGAAGGVSGGCGIVAIIDRNSPEVMKVTLQKPLFNDLVTSLAWSEDGTLLIAASSDNTARILLATDLTTKAELKGHTGAVLSVAVRDGRVATGGLDRTIRIWNMNNGEIERTLTNHSGAVNALAFEPGRGHLLSCSDDKTVRQWDAATGRLISIYREHEGRVLCITTDNSRKRCLLTGASDGRVRRIDLEEGIVELTKNDVAGEWIHAIALLPNAQLALATDRALHLPNR